LVIRVQTRDNEPVDKALRRLRKLCNNEGLTRITKSKAYFEKPSERRRREARERIKSIRWPAAPRRRTPRS
jgi:small subunit ribosomal protein S21